MENLYVNNEGYSAYLGKDFMYEVTINCYFNNYFFKSGGSMFYSNKELDIVESFFINKYIEIECQLYQAPQNYLINNGYRLYIKETKKKRKK